MRTYIQEIPLRIYRRFSQTVRFVAGKWWLVLATGIMLSATGLWVMFSPFHAYLRLSGFVAVAIFATGLLDILIAADQRNRHWFWWLLAGVADLIIGYYLYNNTLITIVLLPLVIGFWTVYKGLIGIGDSLHIRKYKMGNWHRLMFIAVVAVCMALLLLACPLIGIERIFLFSGLAVFTAGIFRVFLAFKVKNYVHNK